MISLLLAHSVWMLLEASFRADMKLMDKCLQIQKSGKHVYQYQKSHHFFGVTPTVPESFMIPQGRSFWLALIYTTQINPCFDWSLGLQFGGYLVPFCLLVYLFRWLKTTPRCIRTKWDKTTARVRWIRRRRVEWRSPDLRGFPSG